MRRALNLKNFNTFAQQLKGARVTEISVERVAERDGVRIKYSAKDPKTRRIFNGEWRVDAGDGEAEKEFFALAAKEFAVKRPNA